MASLAARYAAGQHVAVWQVLNAGVLPMAADFSMRRPDDDDVEDVMRQTFDRVARNVDRLVERLRDLGYRFQCEEQGLAPRRPADDDVERLGTSLSLRFTDHWTFGEWPDARLPRGLRLFGEVVGSVDLMQATDPADADAPANDDPVIEMLGDWDPLVAGFSYAAEELEDADAPLSPLPGGGVGAIAEIAPGFEHKANVSGGMNVEINLPGGPPDPIVHAEGIALPLSTWLRRHMAHGGFFGVPRVVRAQLSDLSLREVEPGIWLPEHPIFARLAADLEPF